MLVLLYWSINGSWVLVLGSSLVNPLAAFGQHGSGSGPGPGPSEHRVMSCQALIDTIPD